MLEAPAAVYEAKRDLWLVAVLWGVNVAMLFAAADVWRSAEPLGLRLPFALLMVAATFLVIWILYGTRYVLAGNEMVALCGPFRAVVPLAEIEEVRPSRSPLAAPAPSLDRLEIRHSGRRLGLLVSPADKEGFLADLKLRCPRLVGRFDRLVTRERAER